MTNKKIWIIGLWLSISSVLMYAIAVQIHNRPVTACDHECKRNSIYKINMCKKIDPEEKTDCVAKAISESTVCENMCKGVIKS